MDQNEIKPASTNKKQDLYFIYIAIIGFLGIFSTTISKSPVLPLFVKDGLGGSDAILGLIAFFSPMAGMLFSFPIGFLMDKLGFKKLIWTSVAIFVVSPLLYLAVTNAWMLIPVRFLHGLATAILMPIVTTAIAIKYSANKAQKLGTFSSATLIGRTIAPIVGGFIISMVAAQHYPALFSYKAVYIMAFLAALPIIPLTIMLTRGDSIKAGNGSHLSWADFVLALKKFVSDHRMLTTALVEMAIYFCYGILETFLPGYLKSLHLDAKAIGLIFSIQIISIALSKPLFGKMADNIDKRYQIMAGIVVVGLSLFLTSIFASYWLIALMSIFFGLGISLATVATATYIADITDQDTLGSSMGALSSIMDVGQSTGPLIAGALITYYGSNALGFSVGTGLCLLAATLFAWANFLKPIPAKMTD